MNEKNKLQVTYFFRKPRPQYFSIEKVFEQVIANLPEGVEANVYRLKSGTTGWWGRVKALFEAYRNRGEINHITGDVTFLGLVLPKKGLIITYHDLESLAQYRGIAFKIIKYLWVTVPVRRAQTVTTISEHTKEKIIEWTDADSNKVVVVPNPLPEEITYYPKEFNTENPLILVMGTKANKNLERIFEAVKDVKCRLLLVGKMTGKQQEIVKEFSLDIENLVHVPYTDIVDAYRRCDILCFPSLYEGFGMPIIEAQATGRPVVTSNFGAMKEVAGEGAVLVSPYKVNDIQKAIIDVVWSEELRKRLIRKGVRNIKQYGGTVIAGKYCVVYYTLSDG